MGLESIVQLQLRSPSRTWKTCGHCSMRLDLDVINKKKFWAGESFSNMQKDAGVSHFMRDVLNL